MIKCECSERIGSVINSYKLYEDIKLFFEEQVKEDIFSKIRKNLFAIFFKKENELLNKLYEIEQPRNVVRGKVIIPKEISIDKIVSKKINKKERV